MLQQQVTLGMLAIFLGVVAGIGLFIPFITISYRRRGTLTLGRTLTWAAALVYFWAIWAYTLLPLPDPQDLICAGINLNPATFITDVTDAISESAGLKSLLMHPVITEMVLNVVLFVPLGFFIRVLGGRGFVVALLTGLAISVFIETTQLTGVWGLYPCAYRVFDVKDMMTNTMGAGIGSLLSLLVPPRWRNLDKDLPVDAPRPITKGRRFLAMVCDLFGFSAVSTAVTVAMRFVLAYMEDDYNLDADGMLTTHVGLTTALVIWLGITLITGRTPGDYAVRLVYRGGPLPRFVARILRLAGGIGLYGALYLLPDPWNGWTTVFVFIALIAMLFSHNGRGLPGVLSRQELVDDREVGGAETDDHKR